MTTKALNRIRWIIRSDIPEVLQIEDQCSDSWDETIMTSFLRQRNCIGVVSVSPDGPIDAYAIYELHPTSIALLRIAVDHRDRLCGIGRQIIDRLKDKLSEQRRTALTAKVHESNLAAQLFFHRCGFLATEVRDELIQFEWHL